MPRSTVIRFALAVIGLTLIQSAILVPIDWHGEAASEQADPIDTLLRVMIVLSSFVFAIVMVALAYFVWRFRAKPGDESDGEPIHGNTKLEIIWTVIPTIIVLFGAGYSWIVLNDIEEAKADRMHVNVTAEQFAWTFEYPGAKVTSTELVVPVDRQVEFTVRAKDVLHSFWVPEWRIKRDAVPDNAPDDTFVVDPNKTGSFAVVCTEYCGVGHPTMRAPVRVVSAAEFEKWVEKQKGGGDTSAGGGPREEEGGQESGNEQGIQIFESTGCGSCHTLAAAGTNAEVGPELDASLKGKDEAYIRRAITDPNADLASGFDKGIMPDNYGEELEKRELDALVRLLADAAKG